MGLNNSNYINPYKSRINNRVESTTFMQQALIAERIKIMQMIIGPNGNEVKPIEGKKETVIRVRYGNFERFIKELFGHDYCFVADQECGNVSEHSFTTGLYFDECDREDVEEFIKTGKGQYLAGNLLDYCAEKGWIENGTYLISVSW